MFAYTLIYYFKYATFKINFHAILPNYKYFLRQFYLIIYCYDNMALQDKNNL